MKRFLSILTLIPILLLSGCASFKREWKAALAQPHAGIEGPWEGSWTSGFNAHSGLLRCVVTHKGGENYEMHYYARWGPFLSASFRSIYKAKRNDDAYQLSGSKDLGALGGTYHFTGTATENDFKADYKSDGSDFGTFEMKRVP